MKKILFIILITLNIPLFNVLCEAQINAIVNFDITNGTYPEGSLVLSGSSLYGMTSYGGANNFGCIFTVYTFGTGYKDLHDFNDTSGAVPYGSLTLSGNKLFGMTWTGGSDSAGTIFSIHSDGTNFKTLINFDSLNGAFPHADLILSGNRLFGMTSRGGAYDSGCIFSLDTNGSGFKILHSFRDTNGIPFGSLIISKGTLYGMTNCGKHDSVLFHDSLIYDSGSVFAMDTNGGRYRTLLTFYGWNGASPWGNLLLSGKSLYGMTAEGGLYYKGRIFRVDTTGMRYKDLLDFNGTDSLGAYPHGSLISVGKVLYGMTGSGRLNDEGGIFEIDTDGTNYKNLANFNDSDGAYPFGSLLLSGGQFFGMTSEGGRSNIGVVFACNENGAGITQLRTNSEEVRVYPNPSNGKFAFEIVTSKLSMLNDKVQVYNMLGEKVYANSFTIYNSQFTIDLSSNPGGLYLYRVTGENGDLLGEGKIVIEK